jgi:hypothetical protein
MYIVADDQDLTLLMGALMAYKRHHDCNRNYPYTYEYGNEEEDNSCYMCDRADVLLEQMKGGE